MIENTIDLGGSERQRIKTLYQYVCIIGYVKRIENKVVSIELGRKVWGKKRTYIRHMPWYWIATSYGTLEKRCSHLVKTG